MNKLVIIIFLIASCNCNINTQKKSITDTNFANLYRRDILGGDSSNTFIDYLILNSNSKKGLTVKQLYNFAKNYCDTIKSNLPVSSVTFINVELGQKVPKPYDYDNIKKCFLYSFSFFKNGIYKNEMSVIIWRGGKGKLLFSFTEDGKKEISSLMNQNAVPN